MPFLYFVAALLALCFVWGLFWPRSQWRTLASWSRRDPDATEPGPVAYGVQRGISGLGIVTFVVVGAFVVADYVRSLPEPEPKPSALQTMWGTAPVPQFVNRVVSPAAVADAALVAEDIVAYQVVDNVKHLPRYLAFLEFYDPPGDDARYIGQSPSTGFSALDSAELVLNLRPKAQCVPLEAVIIETETAVQIGVYSGVASPMGEGLPDDAFCAGGSLIGPSLLLPINLANPLGERVLQNLDGSPITVVEPISSS